MSDYSFLRYLRAKKTVDDRALNAGVWAALAANLGGWDGVRILEAGAGIGTMIERLIEGQFLPASCTYTAVDTNPENISEAQVVLPAWGAARGYSTSVPGPGTLVLQGERRLALSFVAEEVFDYLSQYPPSSWDVLIAHAFLDLVDLSTALPQLFRVLGSGGVFYFSINFDGLTIFEPAVDREYDARILELYHASMGGGRLSGGKAGSSLTGRQLFSALNQVGADITAAGSSDWVVFPRAGGYLEDEAYFLHYIIHTIDRELSGHPALDLARFSRWIKTRHDQIDRGELVYLAHQLDILGTIP